jgi:membrane protein
MPSQESGFSLGRLWRTEIWKASYLSDKSPLGWLYAFLRIASTTANTFSETKTGSRAADLSFSSLLGLGPLVAIAMTVASKVIGQRNPNLAIDALNRLISFVAPQLNEYERLNHGGTVRVNPDLVDLITGFIKGARSETAGFVGAILLMLIVLFLFKSIEDVFNEIWGVRRGRSLVRRFFFYLTVLVLSTILFFSAVALIGSGTLVNVLVVRLPFGAQIVHLLRWSLPTVSFLLLVGALTIFYRIIPNAKVRWRAALAGALVVALLLTANNFLQFLYLKRVLLTRSLFGSLGIVPVLMFGLYIFWLFVLVGGQISYAVQNVRIRNSRLAWGGLSTRDRERLSMAVLMAVCRRFHISGKPISVQQIADTVRLPEQIVNECLNRIASAGYVALSPSRDADDATLYVPAKALGQIRLFEFNRAADSQGTEVLGDQLSLIDPIVREYSIGLERVGAEGFFSKSVEQLLTEESWDN